MGKAVKDNCGQRIAKKGVLIDSTMREDPLLYCYELDRCEIKL